MQIKRILCPIDFSEFNKQANEFASMLAKSNEAEIIYYFAYQPAVPYASHAYMDLEKEARDAKRELEEIQPTIEGVRASWVVEVGPPAEKIIEYARENDVDLIVMGTQGRTGLSRAIMGSVAETIVRKAHCPVLALKEPVPEPETTDQATT
ncbi:MAG: universal stress protein [Pirellulaceae bacterium]